MLHLTDYFLTHIDIAPNFEAAQKEGVELIQPRPEHIDLDIKFNFEPSDEPTVDVYSYVDIKTTEDALDEGVIYKALVVLAGRFYVDKEDFPVGNEKAENQFRHTIIRNTASILIGHGREIIANTTGGMPLGRMLLPTLNLQGHSPQNTPASTRKHKTKAKTK